MSTASQLLFAHVVDRPDEELELDVAALLIAEWEYEELDVGHYLDVLESFADAARGMMAAGAGERFAGIRGINRALFGELGFRGNDDDYYDPRNSFLHEVIDRRTGIPITLSVVYMEVARRLDLEVHGLGFPGHFLVRYDEGDEALIIDPFRMGLTLDAEDLQRLLDRVNSGSAGKTPTKLSADMLEPTGKRQILFRMLGNLAGIYGRVGDHDSSIEVLERMHILQPDNNRVLRELDRLRRRAASVN